MPCFTSLILDHVYSQKGFDMRLLSLVPFLLLVVAIFSGHLSMNSVETLVG